MSELQPILDYAHLCKDVYASYNKIGDVGYRLNIDNIAKQIIIIFKGSSSIIDTLEDIELFAGLLPKAFVHIDEIYAKAVNIQLANPDYEIIGIGHSLGGSYAQYLMIEHQVKIFTFNPFGILRDFKYPEFNQQLGLNFCITGDVVSGSSMPWQAGRVVSWDLPKDFAQENGYFTMNTRQRWKFCHGIDTVIELLKIMIENEKN